MSVAVTRKTQSFQILLSFARAKLARNAAVSTAETTQLDIVKFRNSTKFEKSNECRKIERNLRIRDRREKKGFS